MALIDALPVKGSWRKETVMVANLREALLKHTTLSGWRRKSYVGFYYNIEHSSDGPLEITILYGRVTEFGRQHGQANDYCSYQARTPH